MAARESMSSFILPESQSLDSKYLSQKTPLIKFSQRFPTIFRARL